MKKILKKIINFFQLFGLNLFNLVYLKNFPKVIYQYIFFCFKSKKIVRFSPELKNFNSEKLMSGHYFHQDLLVAQKIFKKNPKRHVDIASRVDGFVSHVASYRNIEIYDIRPIGNIRHQNIKFLQIDIMNEHISIPETDSLSCLHSLEHFGLGRYNDQIDLDGHLKGFNNLLKLLKINGLLYLSFPVSSNPRIEFNAQRIFAVYEIYDWLVPYDNKFKVVSIDLIDDNENIIRNFNTANNSKLSFNYGCAIYTIKRIK